MMSVTASAASALRCAVFATLGLSLAGCDQRGLFASRSGDDGVKAEINGNVKFASSVYGVPASPRLTTLRKVRKGGGRAQVGKPYQVRGVWYYPKDDPDYVGTGMASWYGPNFHGRLTANGEIYDMHMLSAAHKTFPLPSYAWVTNTQTGSRVMVRVNDRGPFASGREIDLSKQAAEILGFKDQGLAKVEVEYIGRAPLEVDDSRMLMATFEPAARGAAPGTMMASAGAVGGGERFAYAPEGGELGASGLAIEDLIAGERISLGLVEAATLSRIRAEMPDLAGAIAERPSPFAGLLTAEIALPAEADADEMLQALWALGAGEAFVARD